MSRSGQIILASQSVVRRTLLERAGVAFTTAPSALDEGEIKASFFGEANAQHQEKSQKELLQRAEAAVAELAWLKAVRVAQNFPEARVIGADQIFISSKHEAPLSKPKDLGEARAQLKSLSGAEATLVTAAVVVRAGDSAPTRLWGVVEQPRAIFRNFGEAEADIVWRLQGEESLHAAGSCCLEGAGVRLLARLDGDLFSFLGLPLLALLDYLQGEGLGDSLGDSLGERDGT